MQELENYEKGLSKKVVLVFVIIAISIFVFGALVHK